MRHLVGAAVELRVAQRLTFEHHGRGVGRAAHLLLEELVHAGVAFVVAVGVVPVVQHALALGRRHQRQAAQGELVGVGGRQRFGHALQALRQFLGFGGLEAVGIEPQRGALRAAQGHGDGAAADGAGVFVDADLRHGQRADGGISQHEVKCEAGVLARGLQRGGGSGGEVAEACVAAGRQPQRHPVGQVGGVRMCTGGAESEIDRGTAAEPCHPGRDHGQQAVA